MCVETHGSICTVPKRFTVSENNTARCFAYITTILRQLAGLSTGDVFVRGHRCMSDSVVLRNIAGATDFDLVKHTIVVTISVVCGPGEQSQPKMDFHGRILADTHILIIQYR